MGMNRTAALFVVGIGAAALLIGVGLGRYLLPSTSSSVGSDAASVSTESAADSVVPAIWTCSMHPQIQQPAPGKCPICGMDLIPLEQDDSGDDGPRTMSMSESSRALADIQTTLVRRDLPVAQVRLVGELGYDETREKSLTARFPARIDTLYVNFTGIQVTRGEHMAEVYSPDLLTAQRELITAHKSDPDSSITRVTREKLRLWDLQPDQIEAIVETGEVRDHIQLRAPIGGVVVSKNVNEGDYVNTGDTLFSIVDLSELWLYLDAYESDLTWLRYGQDVAFKVESFPGETFHGRIAFIEPEVTRETRTISVRVNVANSDRRLKPGMFARATVEARMAAGGKVYAPEFAGKWISPMHPEIVKDGPGSCDVCGMALVPAEELGYVSAPDTSAPLIIPASAALRTGRRAVVYVEVPNRDRPTYEGREIVLGPRAGDFFIVETGLEDGERVVVNGAFKIDSALQIQAKPSMMNPKGGGPPPGHDHSGGTIATGAGRPSAAVDIPSNQIIALVEPYLALQAALAGDDLESATRSVKTLIDVAGHNGPLPELLHRMLAAESLEEMRRPHFDTLSNALITAIRADAGGLDGKLLVMHCPMVYEDRGADWLQADEPLRNPYFGAMMLRCGEITEELSPDRTEHDGHDH